MNLSYIPAAVLSLLLAACAQSPDAGGPLSGVDGLRPAPKAPALAVTEVATHLAGNVLIPRSREHSLVNLGSMAVPDSWSADPGRSYQSVCLP